MVDLFQLPQHLLERVATKFEWKSYFRMQRTCRDMQEFIQNNRNVKICAPDNFELEVDLDYDGYLIHRSGHLIQTADIKDFYGVRFPNVNVVDKARFGHRHGVKPPNFKQVFIDTLRRYRIQADKLEYIAFDEFTNEEYEEFLAIMKPVNLIVSGENYFAPILNVLNNSVCRQMRTVTINTCEMPEDMNVIQNLTEKLENLTIIVYGYEFFSYVHDIKKILRNLRNPLPNLHYFKFEMEYSQTQPTLPSAEELIDLFQDFDPALLTTQGTPEGISEYIFECQLGHDDRICKLNINRETAGISFKFAGNE